MYKNKLTHIQLKKAFGIEVPKKMNDLNAFVHLVDQAYSKYEYDLNILERSIKVVTEELETANKELVLQKNNIEKQNEELKDITYVMVHDLKEPARNISSFLKLLNAEIEEKLSDRGKEFIEHIKFSSNRLEQMLSDLLKYSMIDKSENLFTTVDLNQVFKAALHNLHSQINGIDFKLDKAPLPLVYGSFTHLISLFQNLISNSIKFKEKDQALHIVVQTHEEGNNHIIEFQDNGCGLEQKNKNVLFDLFKRGAAVEEIEGTGIGLSICKKIMRSHSGQIWIDEKHSDGFKVVMRLPKLRAN